MRAINRILVAFLKNRRRRFKQTSSILRKLANSNLVVALLAGFVAAAITNHYTTRQKAAECKGEFIKVQITKAAEVWEKLYLFESAVEEVINSTQISKGTQPYGVRVRLTLGKDLTKPYEDSEALFADFKSVLNKNRVWIGNEAYEAAKAYADATYSYYVALKSGDIPQEEVHQRQSMRESLPSIFKKSLAGN